MLSTAAIRRLQVAKGLLIHSKALLSTSTSTTTPRPPKVDLNQAPSWSIQQHQPPTSTSTPIHSQGQQQQQQEQAYVSEDNPWSIPIYLLSAALISGSIYYVKHQSSVKLDPTQPQPAATTGLDVFGVSSDHDDTAARESKLFNLAALSSSTLWARIQNLFIYPSSIRSPLRSALVYHVVVPDPAKAEASYLTAWDAARALGALDLEAGIALQLARFYADQDAPVPALRWYHLGLERLLGWYADKEERNNHRKRAVEWATPDGQAKLERVAGVLAYMARAKAYAAANPDSAKRVAPGATEENLPKVSVDAYYSMALATMLLATRLSSVPDETRARKAVDAHLGALLRMQVPQVTVAAPATSSSDSAAHQGTDQLVSLLEDMAAYYSQRNAREYAATLRRALLGYMPGSDARDVYCRRATVMNNLAEDLAAAAQDQPATDVQRRDELLAGARQWLIRARDATEGKAAPECTECRAIALNNLGQVAEMRGDRERAVKYLKKAVAEARKAGMVDVRREAMGNLERVEDDIERIRKNSK
ncbi:hypothetical protein BCR44DRAFT_1502886 [Catenaria anguillulae PL171]|uniref:Uncharacterized protein n=1 Tax=Catenaria anguillulae PL171 TaxID=765915 RepID=A0A1Y2H9L8_9FUNG|nr:hypothetical protein BCR44DRAFT_1502886 [Catenaria anguillulae PL171]